MFRRKSIVILASFIGLAAAASLPLLAQPEYPSSPTGKQAPKDLAVPPGIYNAFVFACEGSKGVSGKAVLKSPGGEISVVVSAGDTVIVPFQGWSLGQQGTMHVTENPGATLIVSAVTTSGPIKLEPLKK